MDGSTFDGLVRTLATAGSRRRLLGLLTGSPLVGLLIHGSDIAAARPGRKAHRHRARHQHRHAQKQRRKDQRDDTHSEACIPTGQRCPSRKPRGKRGKHLGCNACCQRSFTTDAAGRKFCGCQPNGGPCTTASSCCSGRCDGGICQATPCSTHVPCPQCQTCNTSSGLCEAVADGTACNDGNACTRTDTCQGGVCVGTNPVVCPPPSDQCHEVGTCDPNTGKCSNPEAPNNTPCNDGNACTQSDSCQSGVCTGSNPVVCLPVPNECQTNSCDPATGLCSGLVAKPNRTPCSGGNICCNGACCDGCCSTSDASGGTCGFCRAFVTSTEHNGNLKGSSASGLEGADAICQGLAGGVSLPGTYKAWLSIGNGPNECPACGRFRQSEQPYLLVNGTQIAANWAALTDGSLDANLNITEKGDMIVNEGFVFPVAWTHTNGDGTAGGLVNNADCQDWTSTVGSGNTGTINPIGGTWTRGGVAGCSNSGIRHLYCFQQD
jgi:hypothetical protein